MSAFVLEKGMNGFRPGKKENKLGIRASDTAELILEDCFVPDENLLGQPGEGFRQALAVLDGGRISIAALGLGTAIGSYETALKYSKERRQFDQAISEFQAIRFALAEMATRIAAAEILTFAAAAEMDKTGKVTLKASEAKLMTGEAAVFCSERGVQIHGGYGFVKDYRAEKFYRDAKICTIGEGTSEVQRLVIARPASLRIGAGHAPSHARPRAEPDGLHPSAVARSRSLRPADEPRASAEAGSFRARRPASTSRCLPSGRLSGCAPRSAERIPKAAAYEVRDRDPGLRARNDPAAAEGLSPRRRAVHGFSPFPRLAESVGNPDHLTA